nr:unnamed protein product [Leishmania braziliensis]
MIPGGCFSKGLASDVDSAAAAEESLSATEASTVSHRPGKEPRHVAFLLERDLKETEEVPHAALVGRCGGTRAWPTGEQVSWSGRAEADALRQRALQCGEDFVRVASGLGYEVVTHTPTAFLKREMTETTAAPVAVDQPEKQPGTCFTVAKGTTASSSTGAAPLNTPSAAATMVGVAAPFRSRGPAIFLREGELDSCSSRSSSLGTEEQVGMVPVLSPLLQGNEPGQCHHPTDASLRALELQVPRTTGPQTGIYRYPAGIETWNSFQDSMFNSAAEASGGRMSPHHSSHTGFRAEHHTNDGANAPAPTTVNYTRVVQSTPTTPGRPLPSPHSALMQWTAFPTRNHPVTTSFMPPGQQSNAFAVRFSILDVTSSRATSNINTSLSTDHLNGHEFTNTGGSQNTNDRFFTPSTVALNTPAVRLTDDEDWPRVTDRSIQ